MYKWIVVCFFLIGNLLPVQGQQAEEPPTEVVRPLQKAARYLLGRKLLDQALGINQGGAIATHKSMAVLPCPQPVNGLVAITKL
jgi:hypothetical protein